MLGDGSWLVVGDGRRLVVGDGLGCGFRTLGGCSHCNLLVLGDGSWLVVGDSFLLSLSLGHSHSLLVLVLLGSCHGYSGWVGSLVDCRGRAISGRAVVLRISLCNGNAMAGSAHVFVITVEHNVLP